MKIIYTSMLGCPKTVDNKLVTEKLEDANGFIDFLKSNLKNTNKLVFITNRWNSVTSLNQPKDEVFNDNHYTNKEYAGVVKNCYELSGICFKQMVVVDCDYNGDFKNDIETADMIFVQGGHTPRGLKILKDLDFENHIKNFGGILMLTGTATKLPASKVLSTHHGNKKEYEIEQGLNLKNYSIRPYFSYSLKMRMFDKKYRARIDLLKDFSKNIDVYALGGYCFMVDENDKIKIYGDCHKITNGRIKQICKSDESVEISNQGEQQYENSL